MPDHAIIIGIDDYAEPKWNLRGAVKDARLFYEWVTGPGGVDRANVRMLLSTSDPAAKALATGDATNESIIQTIVDYQDGAGKDGGRLYFYYAGHGLSAPGVQKGGRVEPVIVPSDVRSLKIHSNRLISFTEIMPCFAGQAPWEQFFFIDACRDFGLEDFQPGIGGVGPWFPPNADNTRRASQYLLYAASPGQKAAETSVGVFTAELLDALSGKEGVEMTFSQTTQTYQLYFAKLVKFVRKRVEETVRRKILQNAGQYIQVPQYQTLAEGADPILVSLPVTSVRKYPLRVRVSPSEAYADCRVAAGIYLPGLPDPAVYAQSGPPIASPVKFELLPQDYSVFAAAEGWEPARATCELYQAREVDLQLVRKKPFLMPVEDVLSTTKGATRSFDEIALEAPLPQAASLPAETRLIVRSEDAMAEVVLRNQEGTELRRQSGEIDTSLEPGMYRVQLVVGGNVRGEELVQAIAGETTEHVLAAPELELGTLQTRLFRNLGLLREESRYVYTAEDRALADGRLASVLGFAAYAKLNGGRARQLRFLDALKIAVPDAAPAILALVGVSGDAPQSGMTPQAFLEEASLIVFDAEERVVSRDRYEPIPQFPVAAQRAIAMPAGSATVRVALPGRAPTNFALACLDGRVTVFILVVNDDGTIETQQYLVPAPGARLDYQTELSDENLRRVEIAQRTYRKTANIATGQLQDLLYGKWTDPLLGCLAGYTLLRRGDRAQFEPAAHNMLLHFPQLPDSHVLAALQWPNQEDRHFAEAERRGTPLFAEGFRALQKWREQKQAAIGPELADIVEGLLPSSVWTSWVLNRPALPMTADGGILPPIGGWGSVERQFPTISEIARSVGLIRTANGQPSATAFVIAPGVVVTPVFAVQSVQDPLSVTFAPRPDDASAYFAVERIEYPPDMPQFAYLHLRADAALPPPLPIATESPQPHAEIYIVSYPVYDFRQKWDLHRFDGTKRISPGRLRGAVGEDGILHHDCSTAPGSAGGAIVDLATHRVIGVHQAAQMKDNLKIGSGLAILAKP